MKKTCLLIILFLFQNTTFAAPKKPEPKRSKPKSATSISVEATRSSSEPAADHTKNSSVHYGVSLGLGTAGKAFHFGPSLNALISVSNTEIGELEIGGQSGFLLHPGDVTSWIIPILAAGQLTFKKTGGITPYAGLAMGVGIFHVNLGLTSEQEAVLKAAGADVSSTDVDFAILVKGGIAFGEDQQFFAELPLGTLGNAFAILPGFGMKF
jgi:hypothetical protein